jgi:hypothetical protein
MDTFDETILTIYLEENPNTTTLKLAKYFYGPKGGVNDVIGLLDDLKDQGIIVKSGWPDAPTWRVATDTDRHKAQARRYQGMVNRKTERSQVVTPSRLARSRSKTVAPEVRRYYESSSSSSESDNYINPKTKMIREINSRLNTMTQSELHRLNLMLQNK